MSVFVCTIDGLKGHFKFIMVIFSDIQQPTISAHLLLIIMINIKTLVRNLLTGRT